MTHTILIAEDDTFFSETIQLVLREHQVKTLIAKNGEEAIQMIDKRQPDLLLLDLLMPKKDGFAVLQYIREKRYTFPVIILSNLSDEMDDELCEELGVKGYYVKSDMDEDQLWPRIKKHLP